MTAPDLLLYRTRLRDAVCRMLAVNGLVPTTTVASTITVSGQLVTIPVASDPTKTFTPAGYLYFADGTTEFPCVIDSMSANPASITVTLSGRYANGTPVTTLSVAHPVGSLLATNIIPAPANDEDYTIDGKMLWSGWPVWRVFCLDAATRWRANGVIQPVPMVSVIYSRLAQQPDVDTLPHDLWTLQQTDSGDADVATLLGLIAGDPKIHNGSAATALSVDLWVQAARKNPAGSTPMHQDYLDIQVHARPFNVRVGPGP